MSESSPPFDSESTAMQELRKLLSVPEAARLDVIEEQLHNPELHAKEIAKVLAEAIRIRNKMDDDLGKVLSPTIESAIKSSVAKNPKPLSDALFPVMGPAIRKSISNTIAMMMQSLNQTLEHAFSVRGLKWRLDALRTGNSFAEIVLLNTLIYRVEQIFLIHRETGILLHHCSFDPALNEDADLVSGMLTAVRDFVRDSFAGGSEQEIENLRMGDLEIIIEQGPEAVLAVVCRGNPPRKLLIKAQSAIEEIQQNFAEELQQFDGNTTDFDNADDMLSPLMISDYGQKSEQGSPVKALLAIGLPLLGLAGWLGWSHYQQEQLRTQWHSYIEQLRSEPGIVITQTTEQAGHYTISGLRDPLSTDPLSILHTHPLDSNQLSLHFQPYHALQEPLILKRSITKLAPPESVKLSLKDNTLHLSGMAMPDWITRAKQTAMYIPGVNAIDTHELSPFDQHGALLEKIRDLLKPPASVTLKLSADRLVVSGDSTQAWAESAAEAIRDIKAVRDYRDQSLVLIDSPAHILKLAYQVLNPPKTIRLSISTDKRLIASGSASDSWINSAREKVKNISNITGYQDNGIHDPFSDAAILRAAIERLQPPPSVEINFSAGLLSATGQAPQTWIEQAKNSAHQVSGVEQFNASGVTDITSAWHELKKRIEKNHIRFKSNRTELVNGEEQQLDFIIDLLRQATELFPASRLHLTGFSGSIGEQQLTLARTRAEEVRTLLVKRGVDPSRIDISAREQDPGVRIWGVAFSLISQSNKTK